MGEGLWLALVDEPGFMLSAAGGSAELTGKTLKELKKQAADDGIKQPVIDTIDEAANPKQHAIFLIEENMKKMAEDEKKNAQEEKDRIEKEQILKRVKQKELQGMSLKDLKIHAREKGIDSG